MDYQQVYEQWLASDELTSEDKRRLQSLGEDEKKEISSAPFNSARQACAACLISAQTA